MERSPELGAGDLAAHAAFDRVNPPILAAFADRVGALGGDLEALSSRVAISPDVLRGDPSGVG